MLCVAHVTIVVLENGTGTRFVYVTMVPGQLTLPWYLDSLRYYGTWAVYVTMVPGQFTLLWYLGSISYHGTWTVYVTTVPGQFTLRHLDSPQACQG